MTAEEEELHRFLPHLEFFHSACLYGVDHIPNVVSDIQNLPQTELAKVASGIQECIDRCSMNRKSTVWRLKFLRDICSSSEVFPSSYWVSDVTMEKRISYGGEASVYIGRHRDRAVAVRLFHAEEALSDVPKAIIREVISHRQLRHPNIVAFIGVYKFEEDFFPSVILEYAEHPSAIKYLGLHPGPESFAKILLGLLEGLYYLHTREPPLIHGDLHDGNIVVSATGDGVLVDFGYSRIKHELGQTNTPHQVGHFRFGAPEISYDKGSPRINEQSDLYSCAMTILALGTLSPPFKDLGLLQACQAAAEGKRPPRHDSLGGLTVEHTKLLWSEMEKMWDHDPGRRPTISAARRAIAQSGIMELVQRPAPFTTSSTSASRLSVFAAACWSTAFAGKSPSSSAPSGPRGPPSIRTSIQRLEAIASRSPSFNSGATIVDASLMPVSRLGGFGRTLQSAAADAASYIPSSLPVWRLRVSPGSVAVPASTHPPPMLPSRLRRLVSLGKGFWLAAAGATSYLPLGLPFGEVRINAESEAASLLSPTRLEDLGRTLRSAAADATSYVLSPSPFEKFRSDAYATTAITPTSLLSQPHLERPRSNLESVAARARSYRPSSSPFGKFRSTKSASSNIGSPSSSAPSVSESSEKSPMSPPAYTDRQKYEA